jgi:hypothetical protein
VCSIVNPDPQLRILIDFGRPDPDSDLDGQNLSKKEKSEEKFRFKVLDVLIWLILYSLGRTSWSPKKKIAIFKQ